MQLTVPIEFVGFSPYKQVSRLMMELQQNELTLSDDIFGIYRTVSDPENFLSLKDKYFDY